MIERLFGVPFSGESRQELSRHYLQRRIDQIDSNQRGDGADIEQLAKQALINDVDQLLHQIASRSQTLLAVDALFISLFATIGGSNSFIRGICIVWALICMTLFFNIWIHFGQVQNYATIEREYQQTIAVMYKRSGIFNANVVYSTVMGVLCVLAMIGSGLTP